MVGEIMKIGPLKRCPNCGHPEGIMYCPVCHDKINNPLGDIFMRYDDLQVKQKQEEELIEAARIHRERTSPKSSLVPQTEQLSESVSDEEPKPAAPRRRSSKKSKTAEK
jgi:uncharacterized Zn finger protein (UPF0148 family)